MSVSTADACHNETRLKLFGALSGDDRRRQHSEKDVQGKKKDDARCPGCEPKTGVSRLRCEGETEDKKRSTLDTLNPGIIIIISHTHTTTPLF